MSDVLDTFPLLLVDGRKIKQVLVEPAVQAPRGNRSGLPLSRSLVELHGGELKIVSRRGEGTTITVALPAWRSATSEPLRDRLSATIT